MLLQGATQTDESIIARTTVVLEESDSRYSSSDDATAIEAPYVLYEGRFDQTPKDDPASFTDVGTGTVAVTCP